MAINYRWAKGEAKAKELAAKVSGHNDWHRCETIAHCGSVACEMRYEKTPSDDCYKEYWLCYQTTSKYPDNPAKWDTTIGFCTNKDFPQLPIKRLRDGLEKIYQ